MKKKLFASLLALACSVACPADDSSNIDLTIRMIAAINERDLESLDRYIAPDLIRHSAATPEVQVRSLEDFRAFLRGDFAAVPDSVQLIDLIFGSGDFVAVKARYIGTQTGAMGPFPPSGNWFELPYVGILRFEASLIKEMWVEWDNMAALRQLGHLAAPGHTND